MQLITEAQQLNHLVQTTKKVQIKISCKFMVDKVKNVINALQKLKK